MASTTIIPAPPATEKHLIQRINHGTRDRTEGVVVHVMAGTLAGTLSWWERADHEADGAHLCFGLSRAVQTAPMMAVCWHAPGDDAQIPGSQNGNYGWVGFEHEGGGTDSRLKWILRRKQRIMSANRCAWVCFKGGLGKPEYGKNVAKHSDFPQGGHPCPGPGFPMDLYIRAAQRAYANLVRSNGRRWTRTPRPRLLAR